jgi:outer membrane protein assembly factor BamA
MKRIILLISLCLLTLSVFSVDLDKNFVVFPMGFYSPETSLALGASFVHFQKPFLEIPDLSNLDFGIAYATLKKQFVINLSTERYLKNPDYKVNGELVFAKYPDNFFGIGADTNADFVESYTPLELKLKGELKRRIFRKLFAGLGYRIHYTKISDKEENGLLAAENILGNDESFLSALGLQLDCDHTNDNFSPNKGFRLEFSSYFYRSYFGSDYDFEKLSIEYTHFYPFFKKHVIAYQFISENTFGDVPFSAMPKLGGSEMMRGFSEGRYMEKKYLAFQTEMRFQVYKRFGMVVFGAIGEVAENFSDFQTDYLRFAYGTGIRFQLREKEKLNFRIDFAFSEEDFKFYVAAREVF